MWEANIRVRQHEDGRAIVYGRYDHETQFQGEEDIVAKAGVLVQAGGNLVSAISEVADTLIEATVDFDEGIRDQIAAAYLGCINSLPALDLE